MFWFKENQVNDRELTSFISYVVLKKTYPGDDGYDPRS